MVKRGLRENIRFVRRGRQPDHSIGGEVELDLASGLPLLSVDAYCGGTTTSNAEPLILRNSSCNSGIRGSGAIEIAQSMPLSATNMPYFFRPLRIAWTSGEKAEMSKSCF